MTLDEVKAHPYWTELNERERLYLERLSVNPDRQAAVKAAYKLRPKSVAPMLGKLERRYQVTALANLLTRGSVLPSKDELLGCIWGQVRRASNPKLFARLVTLYQQVERGQVPPVEEEPEAEDPEVEKWLKEQEGVQ
jgi:hypothetical protein